MAEILAFISSVTAIIEFSEKAPRVARALYDFACRAGELKKDVEFFAADIDTFGFTTKHAFLMLRRSVREAPSNAKLHVILDRGLSKALNLKAQFAMSKVSEIRKKLRRSNVHLGLWRRVKLFLTWQMIWKKDAQHLSIFLQSTTASLSLVLDMVRLDIELSGPITPEKEKEIRELRRQIAVQARTIEMYQNTLKTMAQKAPEDTLLANISNTSKAEHQLIRRSQQTAADESTSRHSSSTSRVDNSTSVLSKSGDTSTPPSTSPSSKAGDSPHSSPAVPEPPPTDPAPTDPASSSSSPMSSQEVAPQPKPQSPDNSAAGPTDRPVVRISATIQDIPSNTNQPGKLRSRSRSRKPPEPKPTTPIPRRTLVLSVASLSITKFGTINDRSVTAWIDRLLPVEIISEELVQILGLTLLPLDPNKDLLEFNFGLGRWSTSIGMVKFSWRFHNRVVYKKGIEVTAYVIDKAPMAVRKVDLILGREYLKIEREMMGDADWFTYNRDTF